jgi:Type I restriction enzyme R protein N terminus (HSDR_N)
MPDTLKPYTMITDYLTGRQIPNIGAEENRQAVERFLVEAKGYSKDDISADVPIEIMIAGKPYSSQVDLVVTAGPAKKRIMVFKCAAGSLGSREREILAAARLLDEYQIPLAIVSDGKTAIVLDTISGKKIGEGMDAVPAKDAAISKSDTYRFTALPPERREREKLVFRTYDSDNVNVQRNI